MGFLKELLGATSGKQSANTVADPQHLSQGLNSARIGWFDMCLGFIAEVNRLDAASGIKVVNTVLKGDGEAAIGAFQIEFLVGPFIEGHKYLGEHARADFMSSLRREFYGEKYSNCDSFAHWYTEPDQGTGASRFTFDVLRYLSGVELRTGYVENLMDLGLEITRSLLQPLQLMTVLPVVHSFGDQSGVAQVQSKAHEIGLG